MTKAIRADAEFATDRSLAIANVNGVYDAGLERLDAAAQDDLSPVAEATISTRPKAAQINARNASIVTPIARSIGDDGASTSPVLQAGRRVHPSRGVLAPERTRSRSSWLASAALANFMDAALQSVEDRVAPSLANELIVRTILDQAPMVERQDAIGVANRGQSVGDDENRTSFGNLPHILLDDPLAFVIEGA